MGRREAQGGVLLASLFIAGSLAGCGLAAAPAPSTTPAPPSVGPGRQPSAAVAQTRLVIEAALRAVDVALTTPKVPYRPGESPRLAAAPRAVFQAALPDAPEAGFIVVYEFPDPPSAATAGNEMAEYLASGPGRVQFPPDSRFVLRALGTTLIFFTYAPSASSDPALPRIADALSTIGIGFQIGR
jgi:hypothetical protein